jgi:hypothetical protein
VWWNGSEQASLQVLFWGSIELVQHGRLDSTISSGRLIPRPRLFPYVISFPLYTREFFLVAMRWESERVLLLEDRTGGVLGLYRGLDLEINLGIALTAIKAFRRGPSSRS